MAEVTLEELVEEFRVPVDSLSKSCSDEHLTKISMFLDWRAAAPHLGLKEAEIEAIEYESKKEEEKRLKILQKWRGKFSFKATYKRIIVVLLTLGRADHAEKVCQLLIPEAGAQQEGPCTPGTIGRTDPLLISATPLSDLPGTPNHQQRETQQLEYEIHELESHFFKVVEKTTSILQKTPDGLSNFKRCLIQLPLSMKQQHVKFFTEKALAIGKAESVEEIFIILALYWNFLNCSLLELIVNKFGDEDTKAEMERYQQKLREFRCRTKVRDYIDKWMHGWPPRFTELSIEMKEEWMDRTLEDLEELRLDVSRKCSFEPHAALIMGAKPGSLRVSFALHSFPMETQILPSLQELLCNQGVLKVVLCGVPNIAIQLHQPPLQNPQNGSKFHLTKGDDTTVEGIVDHYEESDQQQLQELEHKITTVPEKTLSTKATQTEEDSTDTVQLKGRLLATEGLLKVERMGNEELQQQMVELEWQMKQAKLKSERVDLVNKQLHTDRDELTAGIKQREAQMEWERKDKETTVRSFSEREEESVQRALELQKKVDELTKQQEIQSEQLAAKDGELMQLREQFESYQDQLQSEVQSKEQLVEQLQQLLKDDEAEARVQHMKLHVSIPPITFTMANFNQHKKEENSWCSRPFYTHPQGYMMCLAVYANGIGSYKGMHVSVFVHLMHGEYDDSLKWPFEGDVTIQLLNQLDDGEHHTRIIPFAVNVPDDIAGRVTRGERAEHGWGFFDFISHTNLGKYLKNDCIRLHISIVKVAPI